MRYLSSLNTRVPCLRRVAGQPGTELQLPVQVRGGRVGDDDAAAEVGGCVAGQVLVVRVLGLGFKVKGLGFRAGNFITHLPCVRSNTLSTEQLTSCTLTANNCFNPLPSQK